MKSPLKFPVRSGFHLCVEFQGSISQNSLRSEKTALGQPVIRPALGLGGGLLGFIGHFLQAVLDAAARRLGYSGDATALTITIGV